MDDIDWSLTEPCPVRLVHETKCEADGTTPKELSARKEWKGDYEDRCPPCGEIPIDWDVMVDRSGPTVVNYERKTSPQSALDVMKVIHLWVRSIASLNANERHTLLSEIFPDYFKEQPRALCHKECRGLPQPVPLFPPKAPDGAFVFGAWYRCYMPTDSQFVVAQFLGSRRYSRNGEDREMGRFRTLYSKQTARGDRAHARGRPDDVVKGVLSKKPLHLARVSGIFKKKVEWVRNCNNCGAATEHDSVLIGKKWICAWSRVKRGGIALA